jgi:hypothetical protein
VFAGVFQSNDFALTEDDLIGPYEYHREPEIADRYNRVSGTYNDRDRKYTPNQFITVNDTTLRTNRDNGRILVKEIELDGVSGEYQAQRLAFRALNQAGNTGVLILPCGYQASNIRPGDTGTVTIAELGFSSKVFRCVGIEHVDFQGVRLTLKEDSSAAYDDPSAGSYGTRTAAGTITFPNVLREPAAAGIVRDPSFADTLGLSWEAGPGASIISGDTGNGLRLTIGTGSTAKSYSRNLVAVEIANREWFTVQTRVRRNNDLLTGSAHARLGLEVWDVGGVFLEDAEVAIDSSNVATIMPATDTWYDYSFEVQVITTPGTTRVFARPEVFLSNNGVGSGGGQLDFDFFQVVRGRAA